jgi:hypothetical protein
VYAGVIIATAMSLVVASALLGFGKLKDAQPEGAPDADVPEPAVASVATPVAAPNGETVSAKSATTPTPTGASSTS